MNVTIGDTFEISTPNYPYFYPDNIACTWQFASSLTNTGGSYKVHFLEFHTQYEHDYLILGKGATLSADSVLQYFTAVVPSHVVAVIEEPAIWLRFRSDIIKSFTGFSLMIGRIDDTGEYCII